MGNYLPRCCSRSLTWYCCSTSFLLLVVFSEKQQRLSATTRSICTSTAGRLEPLASPVNFDFPPSRDTCCSHLEVRRYDTWRHVSAGSAAVLLIFHSDFQLWYVVWELTSVNWQKTIIGTITFQKRLALETKDLHVYYGQEAIRGIDAAIRENKITALGPSGCGKSTFLRSLNRMNDTIDIAKVAGQILYQGVDVSSTK